MTCPCDLQCREECELCRDADTIKKGEDRKMNEKKISIIEKLGITKGPWSFSSYDRKIAREVKYSSEWKDHLKEAAICKIYHREHADHNNKIMNSNASLIAAAPEMLEDEIDNTKDSNKALIEMEKDFPDYSIIYNCLCNIYGRSKKGSQKATGKTYEQIKDIIR